MKRPFIKDPAFRIIFVILVVVSLVLFLWDYSHRHFGPSRLFGAQESSLFERNGQ